MSGEYGKAALIRLLMERDKLNHAEAKAQYDEHLESFIEILDNSEDPEEWIVDEVGVEPDYLEAFWGYV